MSETKHAIPSSHGLAARSYSTARSMTSRMGEGGPLGRSKQCGLDDIPGSEEMSGSQMSWR
jgi:hypothetical protein